MTVEKKEDDEPTEGEKNARKEMTTTTIERRNRSAQREGEREKHFCIRY